MIWSLLIGFGLVSLAFCLLGFHVYGIILSFKRHALYGVIALLVPGFATIIGIAKGVFKKNLLETTVNKGSIAA